MYQNLAILGVFFFLYSIMSGKIERTPVNGALVFTAFGALVGPLAFGYLDFEIDMEGLRLLAELSLALLLFTDAAGADLSVLKRGLRIPERLLSLGLPLIILSGFGVALLLFPQFSLLEAAILATMLAPTDAALGKPVVMNEGVRPAIREGLKVESGLNDGLCVPALFLFLALFAGTGGGEPTPALAVRLFAEEIGIGLLAATVLTLPGAVLVKAFESRGWITESWRQLPLVALATACFALAQLAGGSGFIAAFVGGLLFGALVTEHKHTLLVAAEGTGDTLAAITWIIFGAVVIGHGAASFSWEIVAYALASLTVIRMVPVVLVLTGTRLPLPEKLFIAWFGPRGLASVVFGVIVVGEALPNGQTITLTAALTILLSVLTHGVSANPLVAWLARREGRRTGSD